MNAAGFPWLDRLDYSVAYYETLILTKSFIISIDSALFSVDKIQIFCLLKSTLPFYNFFKASYVIY